MRLSRAALALLIAGVVSLAGAFAVTAVVNVPMNEALAITEVPANGEAAAAICQAYSFPWQLWSIVRTVACLMVVLLVEWAALVVPGSANARNSTYT
ncbi:MAG: anthrone oxygenase family protein [Rhizobiaceae bacterium]